MDLVLHIGFLLGFVGGLLLSIVLFFKDAAALFSKSKHACFWETMVSVLFSICQAGLSTTGIIAIRIAFTADTEPSWLNAVILCTLQLFIGTNLAWTVRGFDDSHRAVWLAYGSIVWTAPDVAFRMRGDLVHEYELLSRGAIASAVPLALWYHARRTHMSSGKHDADYIRTLVLCIVTNAAATLFQMGGAIVFYSLSLADQKRSNLRQAIFLR
ncbi:uncharacterized protein ALTATR162_LOCUS12113 [Alternaria atra]|uniref:Uncharacterized protein n=1 Tax=Alternaria atra TaxID=119953 RepID=A0A8J2ICR4_9PLEO|nr:uncharacterized protein ALTATR162_LOCUS12113 [Alternaria atra]CAG5189925.1 unnamed protein product [Alternaria atra]